MYQAWNKPKLKHQAPHILNLIDRFNQVSHWVQSAIVSERKKEARAKVLKRFVKIAWECYTMNSFNVIQEIIAALNSASVGRLKLTWKELKPKTLALWARLQESLSQKQNYKAFRETLATCVPPCIPYLGIFLSDLTFIEDGNPDKLVLGGGAQLINFVKRRKVAEVILKIQDYQNKPYNFVPVQPIQDYLEQAEVMDDDALYKASLVAEPRQPAKK